MVKTRCRQCLEDTINTMTRCVRYEKLYVTRNHTIDPEVILLDCPGCFWAQSTVDFPVGGHVNVLSDYKETGADDFIKF